MWHILKFYWLISGRKVKFKLMRDETWAFYSLKVLTLAWRIGSGREIMGNPGQRSVQPPIWSRPRNDPQGFLSRTRNDPQIIFGTEWYHNGTKSVLALLNQFRIYRLSTPIAFTFTEHNFKNRTNKDWKISPTFNNYSCALRNTSKKIKHAVRISKLFSYSNQNYRKVIIFLKFFFSNSPSTPTHTHTHARTHTRTKKKTEKKKRNKFTSLSSISK